MATYAELDTLATDPTLLSKVRTAIKVSADTIKDESDTTPNHTERVKWGARALRFPAQEAAVMLGAVLAINKGLTVAQITGATDAAIQSNVDAAVDLVAVGSA